MSLVVSGPLWTGPLHDAAYTTDMLNLAEEWGWAGSDTRTDLDKLLNIMVAESDPRLPFGFINLDEVQTYFHCFFFQEVVDLLIDDDFSLYLSQVASRAKVNSPALKAVVSTLQKVTPQYSSIFLGIAK